MRTQHARGFTLIEAILVISIGAVLVASGTVLYRQYRQSVGDTAGLQRVIALQAAIESLYSLTNGVYPSLTDLQGAWVAKRPTDYNVSPWGGLATGKWEGNTGVATEGAAIQGGPNPTGNSDGSVPDANAGDSGLLYYWTAPASGGIVAAEDSAGGNWTLTSFRNYLVTVVPNNALKNANGNPSYVFVRGSIPDKKQADLTGVVGDFVATPDTKLY